MSAASLYCVQCRTIVDAGGATCGNCRNGFVSRLACVKCNKIAPQGLAYCPSCFFHVEHPDPGRLARVNEDYSRHDRDLVPSVALDLPLPRLPGLSLERAVVPESRFNVGRHGAIAEVHMGGRDAEILTKVNQVVVLLHALAGEMNGFCDLMDSTRKVIRGCRDLATLLQEEVETRTGPAR